jgi:hypothetical protein
VFRPYLKTEDGSFQFEQLFAVKRAPQFFCELPRGSITALQTRQIVRSWSSRLYETLTSLRPRIW